MIFSQTGSYKMLHLPSLNRADTYSTINQCRMCARSLEKSTRCADTKIAKSVQDVLRPILLTPTLSKILKSLVGRWILSKVSDKFNARQFGALRGSSTTHALIDNTDMWHKVLDDHNSIRALFDDYSMLSTMSTMSTAFPVTAAKVRNDLPPR